MLVILHIIVMLVKCLLCINYCISMRNKNLFFALHWKFYVKSHGFDTYSGLDIFRNFEANSFYLISQATRYNFCALVLYYLLDIFQWLFKSPNPEKKCVRHEENKAFVRWFDILTYVQLEIRKIFPFN